jgi:hypothetical protein
LAEGGSNPREAHIARTLGVETLNRAFPEIYRIVKGHGGDLNNPQHYQRVLALSDKWASGNPWSVDHAFASASTSTSWYAERATEFINKIKANEWSLTFKGL